MTSHGDITLPTPIRSQNLESLYPALGITCADIMNEYISMKEKHLHPMYMQDIAIKVTNCTHATIDALDKSICSTIQKDFQSCLESGQRLHNKCSKQFKESLEMCTAKHIGQLDA